jgi:parallel beta-helix repeat protein
MAAGNVPTTNLTALYTNTTSGTPASPTIFDAAIQDIVQTTNDNYAFTVGLVDSNKLSNMSIINVKDYGAKGDGSTDDTTEIQTALDQGGIIVIPAGTYMINAVTSSHDNPTSGGLSIPSNTTLFISPEATIKAIANSSDSYAVIRIADVSNVRICGGGMIQGERSSHNGSTGEWGYGVCINGGENVTIEDIVIKDCWGDGILVGSGNGTPKSSYPSKNIKISGVVCDNNRRQGMSIIHADSVHVELSTFKNTNGKAPQSGIDLEPETSSGYYCKNVAIVNCHMESNTGDGIQTHASASFTITGCTIRSNTGRGIVCSSTEGTITGCTIVGNTESGIQLDASTGLNVTGNTMTGNKNGIAVTGGSSKCCMTGNVCTTSTSRGISIVGASDNLVSSNECLSNTGAGIYLFTGTENEVIGNLCMANSHGIHLLSTSTGNILNGNRCKRNSTNGIRVESSNDNQIHNNTCTENSQTTNNTDPNIFLFSSSDNSVQSNKTRRGTQTNKPNYGIDVSGGSNNIIAQNDCYTGGNTGGIRNTGTGGMYGAGNRNNDGTFSATPN